MPLNRKNAASTAQARILPEIPDGPADARLVHVIDLGLQERPPWKGVKKAPCNQILVGFELLDHFMPADEDYQGGDDFTPDETAPRYVSRILKVYQPNPRRSSATQEEEYYAALDPKNEFEGDWSQLVGRPCSVVLKNNEKDGKKYLNINGLVPAHPKIPYREPVMDLVVFDTETFDEKVFEGLYEWVQNIINERIVDPGEPMKYKESRVEEPAGEDGAEERAVAAGEESEDTPW